MRQIGFVVFPGFQLIGAAAVTVFEVANLVLGEDAYHIRLVSEHGGAVPSSSVFSVETESFGDATFDTVIFGAGMRPEPASVGLLEFARRSALTSRRLATTCVGTFLLAEAGVLDGCRATTHWAFARELQEQYRGLKVEEDRIYIVEGRLWTSAGMTAGIDMALAMVEEDHGAEVARIVARNLVVYHRRAGGQSQFSVLLDLEPKSDRIQNALDYAKKNLKRTLSVEELADVAHLSPRQFTRAFRAETRQSPAKAVEHLRVETARLMMERGRHSMDEVASETGFADRERMRRAFMRTLGQPPQTVRRNSRSGV